jgi:hypothetical protein
MPIMAMSIKSAKNVLRLADILKPITLVERIHPWPFLQQRFQLVTVVDERLDGDELKMGFDDVVHCSTVSNS